MWQEEKESRQEIKQQQKKAHTQRKHVQYSEFALQQQA